MYTKALGTVRSLYKCTQGRARPRNCLPQALWAAHLARNVTQGKALNFNRSTAENGKAVAGLGLE
jgi:hypothetical protein